MSNQEIFTICKVLAEKGKEPSVALIKSNLTARLPLPTIIAGLQQWKNNPNTVIEAEEGSEEEQPLNLELRVTQLESIVQELIEEVKVLKNKIPNS